MSSRCQSIRINAHCAVAEKIARSYNLGDVVEPKCEKCNVEMMRVYEAPAVHYRGAAGTSRISSIRIRYKDNRQTGLCIETAHYDKEQPKQVHINRLMY